MSEQQPQPEYACDLQQGHAGWLTCPVHRGWISDTLTEEQRDALAAPPQPETHTVTEYRVMWTSPLTGESFEEIRNQEAAHMWADIRKRAGCDVHIEQREVVYGPWVRIDE